MTFPWDIYSDLTQRAWPPGMRTGEKKPLPSRGETPSWWNQLPAEQAAMAPMVPQSTPGGGRTWGELPFGLFMEPTAEPAPEASVPTPPIMSPPAAGAPSTPSAPDAAPASLSELSPDMKMTLMRMGLQMMQPIQPGQSTVGHIAQAGLGGIDYLEAKRRVRGAETLATKKSDLESRQTKAAERTVDIAERKDRELTPAQRKKAEAEAKEAESRAGLYDRSTGRGNAGKFKTKQDLKASLINKLDLTLLEPKELPGVMANINELVGGSGLPDTAEIEAQAPQAAKGGKVPWPKTAKEAIKGMKASNPNPSPSQKLLWETELRKRYPDYQAGTLDQ